MIPLYGCSTGTHVELDTAKHEEIINQDRQNTQESHKVPKHITLSMNEALSIAVQENLDARVSALELVGAQNSVTLEKIRALPTLEYNLTRTGRSNLAASSSQSIITGNESLEPSTSSERYSTNREISARINLIDTATILMDVKNASNRSDIAKERHRKVIQNIHRDVRAAYWRAHCGEKHEHSVEKLIEQAKNHIKNIETATKQKLISKEESYRQKSAYLDSIERLQTLQNEATLAQIELKSLLNLPQSTQIQLTSKPDENAATIKKLLNADIEQLEITALRNRPEMRESFVEKNISIRDTKKEIIRTLPGGELFFALNRDTNEFLANDSWRSYSASIVQNIANLLSLPDRYQIARKNEELNEARRVTLAAAILAQVHIAKHNLAQAQQLEAIANENVKAAKFETFAAQKRKDTGSISKGQLILAQMQAQESKIQATQTLAEAQDAYAALINTLGYEVGEDIALNKTLKKAGVS